MGIFSNQYVNQANNQSPEQMLLAQYRMARSQLLLALILTAVNVGTLLLNVDFYFLFSLAVPYYSVFFGMVFTEQLALYGFLIAGIIAAVLVFAVYVLLYIFSKRKPGCLTALIVLFSIDTVAVIGTVAVAASEGGLSGIFDIVFHGLVLFHLIRGVIAAKKLKDLGVSVDQAAAPQAINVEAVPQNGIPFGDGENGESKAPEDFEGEAYGQKQEETSEIPEEEQSGPENTESEEPEYKTEPIGVWDGQGNIRLAAIYNGVEVKATRKFSCTELVIDGKVYDTFDKIIEVNYTLAAEVNGVKYIYAQDGLGQAVLTADGNTLAAGTFAI